MSRPLHLPCLPRARLRAAALVVVVAACLAGPGGVAASATIDATRRPTAATFVRSPRHVHQKEENCIWAAGAMLVDKWTHGRIRVTQNRLRQASGDKEGGSSLRDLSRGVARATGIRLHTSPSLGDAMYWWQLLDRLENGGGAVLVGSYGNLPDSFTRWDPTFARKAETSHAVYVERYDRVRGRVWLMDPLATWNFPGEWIDVEDLHRFATISSGGFVEAAATPARRRPTTAPLTDQAYVLGPLGIPRTVVAGSSVPVRVPLTTRDDFPAPDAQRIVARWTPLDVVATPAVSTGGGATVSEGIGGDPASPVTAASPTLGGSTTGLPTPGPVPDVFSSRAIRAGARGFATALGAPTTPGRYLVSVAFRPVHGRSRRLVRPLASVIVEVVPSYAARISVPHIPPITVGQELELAVRLANIGEVEWTSPSNPSTAPVEVGAPARLVATWRSRAGDLEPAGQAPVDLAPGASGTVKVTLVAPISPGTWVLELVVMSPNLGSTTPIGLNPATVTVHVRPAAVARPD